MMETIYVNRADWDGPDVTGARIFNAPRPLYGAAADNRAVTWTGRFRAGTFYAAVWPDGYRAADMVAANERDGAVEVQLVDNAEVRRMVEERLAERGYAIADYEALGMGVAAAAAENGLGGAWHEDTP
jgi:hypothetical protein